MRLSTRLVPMFFVLILPGNYFEAIAPIYVFILQTKEVPVSTEWDEDTPNSVHKCINLLSTLECDFFIGSNKFEGRSSCIIK